MEMVAIVAMVATMVQVTMNAAKVPGTCHLLGGQPSCMPAAPLGRSQVPGTCSVDPDVRRFVRAIPTSYQKTNSAA